MSNLLEKLWYGNICPQEQSTRNNPEINALIDLITRNRDKLCKAISDDEKETLEKYDDCVNEMHCIIEQEIFAFPIDKPHDSAFAAAPKSVFLTD